MVLGLGSKKKGTVQLVFKIVVHEVKPWPGQSLPSRVLIQWLRGDKRSGVTKAIHPDRDRLVFNESLRIPATLYRLGGGGGFQKKCIVFSVSEAASGRNSPRGQPIGRAVLDLGEYGGGAANVALNIPIATGRKEFKTISPLLYLTISTDGGTPPPLPPSVGGRVAATPTGSGSISGSGSDAGAQDNHEALIAALASDEDDIAYFTDNEEDDTPTSKVVTPPPPPPVAPPSSPPAPAALPSPAPAALPAPAPVRAPPAPPVAKDAGDARNERVQRILSSGTLSSPAKAAAVTAASKRISTSSVASSSSDYDDLIESPTVVPPAIPTPSKVAPEDASVKPKPQPAPPPPAPPQEKRDFSKVAASAETKKQDLSVLQAARTKFAESAGERTEKLDKKAVEEARGRAAVAEAKAAAAEERSRLLQLEIEGLKDELRDAAALEAALYSAVAQHGTSPHKLHSPARRLARIYSYACKHPNPDRRASAARNCASGLVVVARACENDVSRLTFWWSNVVVLRGMISQTMRSTTVTTTEGDWTDTRTLTSTLERIEAWIFGRIVESVWWQSLTPHMQSHGDEDDPESPTTSGGTMVTTEEVSVVTRLKKSVRGLLVTDIADSRQGSISIELWKSAFLDALHRLCPVRAGGHDCGCLKVAAKMIIEQCVARLDVAMFNAILRDSGESTPTDPISDPISDLSVLPIPPDGISFGGGAQLKNVISTWSTWLLSRTTDGPGDMQEVLDKMSPYFTLLRAMSDLLMLPKDMLMDKSVRKEVCPALSLLLIRRIISKFVPDEFSPDPVPPSLVAALNAEISMERQRVGEEDISVGTVVMASAPPVVYFPPLAAAFIPELSPDSTSAGGKLSRNSSILRKGHTSDDELEEVESPLFLLVEGGGAPDPALHVRDATAKRYHLLRDAWRSN